MSTTRLVFIPDKLNEDALRVLAEVPDLEVDARHSLPLAEKLAVAARAQVVIVRSATQVDRTFLEAARSLELVVRAGVGVDNIDVEVATRRGIIVQNIPEGNVRSAAEHTIGMILAVARNIPQAHAAMKDGKWDRTSFVGVEVAGKTLGIVGLGKIGRHVVAMAGGLGFKILAYDPYVAPRMAQDLGVELVPDVGELASRVDFLTVHVPKSDATAALIDAAVLARARRGLFLVNCARGGIVDEKALLDALERGQIAGAALDVFEKEPPGSTPLVLHPRVIVTPHLGASTREAQENVAIAAARQVADYLVHRKLHSPVNAPMLDPDLGERFEPYRELATRLGQLQAQLLEGNPVRVVIKFYGDIFEPQVQSYLSSCVLVGFLGNRSAQPVNWINVRAIAKEQGLVVEESAEGKSRYFVNMIKVEVADRVSGREVGGSIRGRRGVRLVSLDNYQFDAVLEGVVLMTANEDRPGMIGTIGQILSSHAINISYVTLGRDRKGGTAVSLWNLDEPRGETLERVLADLRGQSGILWARAVAVT